MTSKEPKLEAINKAAQWNETTFFLKLASKYSLAEQQIARHLYNWAISNDYSIRWGSGKAKGTFTPVFCYRGEDYRLFAVWTTAGIEFLFKYLVHKPPFNEPARQQELLDRFNAIPAINLPPDTFDRFPGVSLLALQEQTSLDMLLTEFDWLVEQLKMSYL